MRRNHSALVAALIALLSSSAIHAVHLAAPQVGPPGAFDKTLPDNNATGQSTTLLLQWQPSAGAAAYELCLDTTLNSTCDTVWIPFPQPDTTGTIRQDLAPGATYEWQVRALGTSGTTAANGGVWWRFTTRVLPAGTYLFDDMETAGAIGWGLRGDWDVTSESAHSPTHAWSDSPGGPYESEAESELFSPTFSLAGAVHPALTFWHRYEFAPGDRGVVRISIDGGMTFSDLRSFPGSDSAWKQVSVDLTPYAGHDEVTVLFTVLSDGGITADGWYIDDVIAAEPTFSDDPLIPGVSSIRGIHISELRARVDALRTRFGLAPYSWTDSIVSFVTVVRSQHIADLRMALLEVYTRIPRVPPLFTDPVIIPGVTAIRAVHVQDLRSAVIALE